MVFKGLDVFNGLKFFIGYKVWNGLKDLKVYQGLQWSQGSQCLPRSSTNWKCSMVSRSIIVSSSLLVIKSLMVFFDIKVFNGIQQSQKAHRQVNGYEKKTLNILGPFHFASSRLLALLIYIYTTNLCISYHSFCYNFSRWRINLHFYRLVQHD